MLRALELARFGYGSVAPNPMVGAVIVFNDRIIGEGFHEKFGGPHAEVNAISSVKDKSLLSKATMYVTLEPCSHHGKTPPCANLIVAHQLTKVVIASQDPNESVNGAGVKILRENNIEVELGLMEDQAKELNKAFFTYHQKKRPFVTLKWAESKDGFIGKLNERVLITQKETQVFVHKLRNEHQSILIGKNTALVDNPHLTVRAIEGSNPIRIVLDSNCETPSNSHIFNEEAETIVINTLKDEQQANVRYVKIPEMTPEQILRKLYEANIVSVLVEGGSHTIQSFLDSDLWDEIIILIGQGKMISGVPAPKVKQRAISKQLMFGDTIKQFVNG